MSATLFSSRSLREICCHSFRVVRDSVWWGCLWKPLLQLNLTGPALRLANEFNCSGTLHAYGNRENKINRDNNRNRRIEIHLFSLFILFLSIYIIISISIIEYFLYFYWIFSIFLLNIFSIKHYWLRQINQLHAHHRPVQLFNNDWSPCVWML